jgi:hypothetical protein
MVKKTEKKGEKTLNITPPNMAKVRIDIKGTAPYMQFKFSEKARAIIRAKHEAGSRAKKGSKKGPRDFEAEFVGAQYRSKVDGRNGINAACFRNAMISACRLCGFKMTLAKLSVFVEADAYDPSGTPLVYIEGRPVMDISPTRNATGVADLRARPRWDEWSVSVRVRYDADQFCEEEVINLMARVGAQGGIGEGRPDSKSSAGLGYGLFTVVGAETINPE